MRSQERSTSRPRLARASVVECEVAPIDVEIDRQRRDALDRGPRCLTSHRDLESFLAIPEIQFACRPRARTVPASGPVYFFSLFFFLCPIDDSTVREMPGQDVRAK